MPSLMLPVFIQVLLTFYLLARTAQSRTQSIKADPALLRTGALDATVYSEKAQQFSNCYRNQFELPVLFYVVIILFMITGGSGPVMTVLAWAFVGLRIVHMLIHTGSNNVRHRFYAFAGGMLAVLAMWIWLGIHYFT